MAVIDSSFPECPYCGYGYDYDKVVTEDDHETVVCASCGESYFLEIVYWSPTFDSYTEEEQKEKYE